MAYTCVSQACLGFYKDWATIMAGVKDFENHRDTKASLNTALQTAATTVIGRFHLITDPDVRSAWEEQFLLSDVYDYLLWYRHWGVVEAALTVSPPTLYHCIDVKLVTGSNLSESILVLPTVRDTGEGEESPRLRERRTEVEFC